MIQYIDKPAFSVVGKMGSTDDGKGFIQALWADANAHFSEVQKLAKVDAQGDFSGFWGAMTDMSHSFLPWTDGFSRGLYLAGVECTDDAEAPDGWAKWQIPGFRYAVIENKLPFTDALQAVLDAGHTLAGAVQDFNCPTNGKSYLYFPIARL